MLGTSAELLCSSDFCWGILVQTCEEILLLHELNGAMGPHGILFCA